MTRMWTQTRGDAWRRVFGTMLIALLFAVSGSTSSFAHAVLLAREPDANAVLATAPASVRLRFDEVVTPVLVRVLDASGKPVTKPDSVSEIDSTVTIALPKALPAGSYVVTYRVISADSHPVGGSFVFAIGTATADTGLSARLAGDGNSAMWSIVMTVLRASFYLAFLIAAGGGLFLGLIDRRRPVPRDDRRSIRIAAGIAALLIAASLGVEGTAAADLPLSGLLDASAWRIGITSTLGTSALITIIGLAVLIGGTMSGDRYASAGLIAGAAIGAIGFAATGHVAIALPHGITTPVLVLHVLCASFWIGALPPLARRLWQLPPHASMPIVMRFSRFAIVAVSLLFLAGLIMAAIQVRDPAALLDTDYGWRLVAKLVLVLGLLAIAATNQRWLTPRLTQRGSNAPSALRRTIFAELGLAIGIVVATAMLGETPPPRALAEAMPMDHDMAMDDNAPPAGFTVATMIGNRTAIIALSPARQGQNRLTVTLLNSDGTMMSSPEVSAWLSNPALGIEAAQYRATPAGPGEYTLTAPVPVAGLWKIEIDALVTDFEKAVFITDVSIQ